MGYVMDKTIHHQMCQRKVEGQHSRGTLPVLLRKKSGNALTGSCIEASLDNICLVEAACKIMLSRMQALLPLYTGRSWLGGAYEYMQALPFISAVWPVEKIVLMQKRVLSSAQLWLPVLFPRFLNN